MTNNELLAEINLLGETSSIQSGLANALRAVVELHKPWTAVEGDQYFWGFRIQLGKQVCPICGLPSYPCPTIQAIEKELS